MICIKQRGKITKAYRLGTPHPALDEFIRKGKLVEYPNGIFEVFSREAVHGKGEIAHAGDYIKVESSGEEIYPNSKEFFEQNHRPTHRNKDEYEQLPKPLLGWCADEPMRPEVEFLIKHKGLVLDENDFEHYFTAPLWGTVESAAKDAVLIFYSIDRDSDGNIQDAAFNFVARTVFDADYEILER